MNHFLFKEISGGYFIVCKLQCGKKNQNKKTQKPEKVFF